jgi:hypothetical protein
MDKTVLAIRAISSEYAKRWLMPLLIIGIVVYIVLMVLIGWIAAAVSSWWWFLAIVPTLLFLIALGFWVVARVILSKISPTLTKRQKTLIKQFNARIDGVAERIATPKFVVLYRIIKDVVIRPTSSKTFIGEIAQEPGEMRRAFDELRNSF